MFDVDNSKPATDQSRPGRHDHHHAGWLTRVLRRRFGTSADDLVQEAFLRVIPYETAGVVSHPSALLMRIAINVAHDSYRRLQGSEGRQPLSLKNLHDASQPVKLCDKLETLVVKAAVMNLPPLYRDVFILSRLTGLSYG